MKTFEQFIDENYTYKTKDDIITIKETPSGSELTGFKNKKDADAAMGIIFDEDSSESDKIEIVKKHGIPESLGFENFVNELRKGLISDEADPKDVMRIQVLFNRSKDEAHFQRLATTMANAIKSPEKSQRRGLAAESENHHDVAEIFFDRAKELGFEG